MGSPDRLDRTSAARLRRRALARLMPALLTAIAGRATPSRVAHILSECLPPTAFARRVTVGLALAPAEPVRVLALGGQAELDGRRHAVKRLVACLEAMASERASERVSERAGDRAGDGPSRSANGPGPGGALRLWPGHTRLAPEAERAVIAFANGCGAASIACLTLHEPGGGRLILLFERAPGVKPFEEHELEPLRTVLPAVAEWTVESSRRRGAWRLRARGTWQRRNGVVRGCGRILPAALSDRLTPRRTALLMAACALLFVASLPVPRTVTAQATLQSAHRQAISAALDGHLVSVHAHAGDRVVKGQLLARLDDRDALDARRALAESAARVDEELSRALALRDRPSLARLRAERASIAADAAAAERRVQHGRVTAPFGGVLLAGDPDERLGAPVSSGEVLFELGTEQHDRLMLEIDERDVRLVEAGLPARVRMAGLPTRVWQADLQSLEPVAIAEPGRNVFRMPATLIGDIDDLRPGMQGVARIATGRRALARVWTRSLRERLTLLAWRVGLIR